MQRALTTRGIFVTWFNSTNRNSCPIHTDPHRSKCRGLVDFLIPRDEHRWVKWVSTTLWSTCDDLKQWRVDVLGNWLVEGFPGNGTCPCGDRHNIIGSILETLSRTKLKDKCLCAKPAPLAIRGWRNPRGNLLCQRIHAAQRDHRLVEVDRNAIDWTNFAIWGDTSNRQRAGIHSGLLPGWRWRECRRHGHSRPRGWHAILWSTEGNLVVISFG